MIESSVSKFGGSKKIGDLNPVFLPKTGQNWLVIKNRAGSAGFFNPGRKVCT
jgi:hypothetical protein